MKPTFVSQRLTSAERANNQELYLVIPRTSMWPGLPR